LLAVLIAALIKTVSPGPVFYKQQRVGHRRARFMCWKFRTMETGADTTAHQQHLKDLLESDAPLTKLDEAGDPRLIPCGAMLRATGLDELAQLINVLRGEMSLVGPRPCMPYEEESYRHWQKARFDTLPGLTGLWQVSGKNKTTFTEMVTLDIYYAHNKSLWLDLKIMAGTLSVLVSQVRETRSPKPVAAGANPDLPDRAAPPRSSHAGLVTDDVLASSRSRMAASKAVEQSEDPRISASNSTNRIIFRAGNPIVIDKTPTKSAMGGFMPHGQKSAK